MVLYDNRVLDAVRELQRPERRRVRFALRYNLKGKTVSMCSSIDQKNRTTANEKCMSDQDLIVKLKEEFDKLPYHDARISTVERTTTEILSSVKDLVKEISGLAKNVAVMCVKHDNSKEQVEKLEKKQNEMGAALRAELKEIDDRARKETIKVNTRIGTLETRQSGILAVLGRAFPWALSAASFLLLVYTKFK